MNPAPTKRKALRWVVIILSLVALFCFWPFREDDPLFRGKRESVWINELKYWDDAQVKEWRSYGDEGVQVLIRGLERTHRPVAWKYREIHGSLPRILTRWLPSPPPLDINRIARLRAISLLSRLGDDAKTRAATAVSRALGDEDPEVRELAISFFTSTTLFPDEKCLLNQLPPDEKKRLLPYFVRAMQMTNSAWASVRNHALTALRFYAEQKAIVTPLLLTALQDKNPHTRLLAADALWRVDSTAAEKANVLSVMIAVTTLRDENAPNAVYYIDQLKSHPDRRAAALAACVGSTDRLTALCAVLSLERIDKYRTYANIIIPALEKASALTNGVAPEADRVLKEWTTSNAVTNNT